MLRNGLRLIIVTLLVAAPVFAHAWTLTIKVNGGSVTPPNTVVLSGGVSRTVSSGTVTVYPSSATTVTINTAAGYTSSATLDGFAATSRFTLSSGSHTVAVSYSLPPTASVGITQSGGGMVNVLLPNGTWTSTGATGLVAGTTLKYSVAANSDYLISDYTVNGAKTVVSGGATGQVVTGSFVAAAGSNTLGATFRMTPTITGSLSVPTNGYTTQPVNCSTTATSNDTGLLYAFQVTGPATFSRGASTSQSYSFTPTLPGTYLVTTTVTSANGGGFSASASVPVSDYLDYVNSQCESCHSTQSPEVVSGFLASKHREIPGATCTSCHTPDAPHSTGINPTNIDPATFLVKKSVAGLSQGSFFCMKCHDPAIGTSYSSSPHPSHGVVCTSCHKNGVHNVNFVETACGGCHYDASGNVAGHPFAIGSNPCASCHNPHALTVGSSGLPAAHFNNLTGAGYPASYVTSRSTCGDCHSTTATNAARRGEWALSKHGDTKGAPWIVYDFKTRSGCVQCHTKTGFVAYSTGRVTAAWGIDADKTKEVLACSGCHSDVGAGTVRSLAPVRPFADDPYRNRDVGTSNVCMDCHSGTNNGVSIQARVGTTADFRNLPFIAPHYFAAGGTLHGVAGFHFPGRSYDFYSSNTHRGIGMANNAGTGTNGPCATCHMSAPQSHLYQAVTKDSNGSITAISATVCVGCHKTFLGPAQLDGNRASFQNALDILKAMLASKGFVYTGNYPSFFANTNWGQGQDGANTMGAAFNYVLLANEPGAYAHNSQYARQLIVDSLDILDNGQLDGSAATLAVPNLRDSGAISAAAADSFLSYQNKNVCTSCHGGTSNSATPMATNAHPAHLTADYGPGGYLGTTVSACQACHLYGAGTHANGTVDLVQGAGSACAGCHAGTPPAWVAGRLSCTSCHAAVPAVLPNGVAAPYKANFAGSGHGQFSGSSQCTDCHDANSRHISGSLGSYTRLRLSNDNSLCASCHNNAALVRPAFYNMSTHVTPSGRALACLECHDPHGTTNLAMIRSQINGSNIVFLDENEGLIDPVTNRGLCQVCHTQTNHYRAGVPEAGHFTAGCLGCHPHNGKGGAFRPVGGCNACHGYPPAPKNPALAFGVHGQWSSARFEDYSGGGGAHLVAAHVPPTATPDQGWAVCSVCHNGGADSPAPYHKMITPVKNHIDNVTISVSPKLRFKNAFTVYTGALLVNPPAQNRTGSCYNISCHMNRSARWSTER